MKIAAIALQGNSPWPDAVVSELSPGLNVFHGPPASGKTVVADLVAHAVCGRRFMSAPTSSDPPSIVRGEVVVESGGHRYRLRRSLDEVGTERLTVAPLDGAPVDSGTVRALVYGLSPALVAPMYTINFRETLRPESLLAGDFASEFRAVFGDQPQPTRRVDGLQPIYKRIHQIEWELTALVAALGYRRLPRTIRSKPQSKRCAYSASNFLTKLTDGELRQIVVRRKRRDAVAVDRLGIARPLDALTAGERDLVYLSICLALVSAAAQRGVQLPLILDEPFVRFNHRETAALIGVLDEIGRSGHQILLFTARKEAAERLEKLGVAAYEMQLLSQQPAEPAFAIVAESKRQASEKPNSRQKKKTRVVKRTRRQAG